MKKLKITSYVMKTKWVIILLATILLVIFGRVVTTPALTKSAIVVGVGIDFDSMLDEFEVSAQIVMVGSSVGDTSSPTQFITYTQKGKTVATALDTISQKAGLKLSLAHCNVLFLSQSALGVNMLHLFSPLIKSFSLPHQSIVLSGEEKPKDIITASVGTTVSSSFFLQNALISQEGSDGMIRTTCKDMVASFMSRSHSTIVPFVTLEKIDDKPITEQGKNENTHTFNLSKILATNGKNSLVVSGKMAEALTLYASSDATGTLNYTADDGSSFEFRILDHSVSKSANGREIKCEIQLKVDLLDLQFVGTNTVLSGADKIVIDAAAALSKQLENCLEQLFALSLENDVDFLALEAKAYQSVGRTLEEDCLQTLTFSPKVAIQVQEAS